MGLNEERLIDAMQTVTKLSGRIMSLIRAGANPMQVYNEVLQVIGEANTADAVKVVRCENCVKSADDKWPASKVWCNKFGCYMDKSGYCSFGDERKNDK